MKENSQENNQACKCCECCQAESRRNWKDVLLDAFILFTFTLLGFTLGLAACKFCEPLWRWLW